MNGLLFGTFFYHDTYIDSKFHPTDDAIRLEGFSERLDAMSSDKFKDAYDSFQKAYQELTKKN